MAASYAYSFTRIGCLIMVLMDCCDIFLPVSDLSKQRNSMGSDLVDGFQLAKMLRYIALST
ncbi:hypothetical protein ACXWRO_09095, partial [Streptococcus pyogenes]